jgi:hypothetical protein
MKNDLKLLAALSFVLAIVLSIAVARGGVSRPNAWNPLRDWPYGWCVAAFLAALVALVSSGAAIGWSDQHPRKLPYRSAILEWAYSPDEAAKIVKSYDDSGQRSQALRGVLLDSVAFIPSYMLLIAVAAFAVARNHPAAAWRDALIAAGWCAFIAAAFDYLENAGIYAALGGLTTRLAPLTYAACQLKWVIALTAADFTLIAFVLRLVSRART